jgi:hypothetical protein
MGLAPPPTTADGLVINKPNTTDTSDFQFGLLLIWDKHLRSDQLRLVYNSIEEYKKTGILL